MPTGTSFDTPILEDDVEEELNCWSKRGFPLAGEHLQMRWLSQDEAIAIAPEVFGVTWCLDNCDQVIWCWPDK